MNILTRLFRRRSASVAPPVVRFADITPNAIARAEQLMAERGRPTRIIARIRARAFSATGRLLNTKELKQ